MTNYDDSNDKNTNRDEIENQVDDLTQEALPVEDMPVDETSVVDQNVPGSVDAPAEGDVEPVQAEMDVAGDEDIADDEDVEPEVPEEEILPLLIQAGLRHERLLPRVTEDRAELA